MPIIQADGPWFRSHPVELRSVYYGRLARNRFDDPRGEYGVFYVADDPCGAFVETFGQLLSASTTLPRVITSGELASRALSTITCRRPLKLVDLTGPGLARIGADSRLFFGEHRVSREWSRAFHEHPSKVDGLFYPTRHDPTCKAAAIFNEALDWADIARATWLSQPALLREILQRYRLALIESRYVSKPQKKGPSIGTAHAVAAESVSRPLSNASPESGFAARGERGNDVNLNLCRAVAGCSPLCYASQNRTSREARVASDGRSPVRLP